MSTNVAQFARDKQQLKTLKSELYSVIDSVFRAGEKKSIEDTYNGNKFVQVIDLEGYKIPVYIMDGKDEPVYPLLRYAATLLMPIHLPSPGYKQLRRTIGFQGAKASIKSITAHNSKLGVNWSVNGKKFELSRSK